MTKFSIFLSPVLFFACVIAIVSCRNGAVEDLEPQSFMVSLELGGELLEIDTSPLEGGSSAAVLFPNSGTKVGSDDLYGVQVWARRDAVGSHYEPYCLGIFDSPESISIQMYDKQLYKIEVTMIVDGKKVIAVNNLKKIYREPLVVTGSGYAGEINEIVYSESCIMAGLSMGTTALIEGSSYTKYNHPDIDRYYGSVIDFRPGKDSRPMIDTKRVVFGVQFNVTNLTDGHLEIEIEAAPNIRIENGAQLSKLYIFTLKGSINPNLWIADSYSESVPVVIRWIRGDNTTVDVANQSIDFSRRTLHTINIPIAGSANNSGSISINTENPDWNEAEITIN